MPMQNFDFIIPTRIYFGRKILKDSLRKERTLLSGNLLIVTTGRSLIKIGYIRELMECLSEVIPNSTFTLFDEVDANPKVWQVEKAVRLGIEKHVRVIIGFGGGSAIDAAKAVAVGIGGGKPIDSFLFDGAIPPDTTLPVIAIPTTAGTGTELSKGAILTSTERTIKTGLRGENLCPKIAIVDSYFTEKIPERITIDTGFDVFAHALESFVSKKANPFSEMLSLEAIKIVIKNLPSLKKNLANTEARNRMSYASMIMGMNLASVGTALPHRLQYPIGARTDTSHGQGLMALYPSWLKYEYKYSKEKLDEVAKIIINDNEVNNKKLDSIKVICCFIKNLGFQQNLKELGLMADEVSVLEKDITGNVSNDPVFQEQDIIQKIYKESYLGE